MQPTEQPSKVPIKPVKKPKFKTSLLTRLKDKKAHLKKEMDALDRLIATLELDPEMESVINSHM
jgi:hypothetical protein